MTDFWKRFSRNRSAVLGLAILLLVVCIAAIASLIYPEDPFRLTGKPMSEPGANGFLLGVILWVATWPQALRMAPKLPC